MPQIMPLLTFIFVWTWYGESTTHVGAAINMSVQDHLQVTLPLRDTHG